jgi:hypothetical protein
VIVLLPTTLSLVPKMLVKAAAISRIGLMPGWT